MGGQRDDSPLDFLEMTDAGAGTRSGEDRVKRQDLRDELPRKIGNGRIRALSTTTLWLLLGAAAIVFIATTGRDIGADYQRGEVISAVPAGGVRTGGPLLAADLVSTSRVAPNVGADTEVGALPTAPDGALGIEAEEAPGQGLQVKDDVFVPPLVMVVQPKETGDGSTFPLPDEGSGALSSEMLRIIAKMSPEQIDALTLLLLSDGQTPPAGILPEETAADTNAPWIGNWNDADVASGGTAEVASDDGDPLGAPWRVIEETDGSLFVEIPGDTFSRIPIEPGLVLGSAGTVLEVRKTANVVLVRLTDGRMMSGARNPSAAATDLKRAAERSKGDSRMEAVAPVVFAADSPAETGDSDQSATTGGAQATIPSIRNNGTTGPGWVQVGSFRDASNAQKAEELLRANGFETVVLKTSPATDSWHVVRARAQDPDRSTSLEELRAMGFPDAYTISKSRGTSE